MEDGGYSTTVQDYCFYSTGKETYPMAGRESHVRVFNQIRKKAVGKLPHFLSIVWARITGTRYKYYIFVQEITHVCGHKQWKEHLLYTERS